jgi:hypothetical protein
MITGNAVRLRDASSPRDRPFYQQRPSARIGEVARGYAISKRRNIPFTYAVSTVFIDGFSTFWAFCPSPSSSSPARPSPVGVQGPPRLVAIFVVCIIVLFAVSREKTARRIAGFLEGFKRPFLVRLATRVLEIQENLRRISTPGQIALFIVLSIANWLL